MPITIDSAFRKRQYAIFALAWPMILSNLSIPLFGIVDTAILGHLPDPQYLAAVAIGSTILSYMFWAFGFLRMGTTALVAQASGAQDWERCVLSLLQSCALAAVVGFCLIAIHPLLLPLFVNLMETPIDIAGSTLSYCSIRIWSAPAVIVNYAIIGWFIGLQNTRAPLIILLAANLANILLDGLFIIYLDQNSDGAAKASALADYVGLLIGLSLVRFKLKELSIPLPWSALKIIAAYPELIRVNRHLFVRTALLLFVIAFMISRGAQLGESVLAANAILMQLLALTAYGLDGFAHAAEALVGKSAGQKNRAALVRFCWDTSLWALLTACALSIIFGVFKGQIIHGFTQIDSVIATLSQHYFWIIILPLLSVLSYQLDGIFIGLNRSVDMQYSMIISVFLIYFPLWWFTQSWGNHGLWFSFCIFNASRGMSLIIFLRSYFKQMNFTPGFHHLD